MTGSDRVAHLTTDEFAAAMVAGRWLLLPFGAIEQHGSHLPLATDLLEAEYVCAAVAEQVGGIVAPGLPYGICRTMRHFPGTISLSAGTFQVLVRELVGEYVRHGARKLALYSGHAEPAQLEALREAVVSLVDADRRLTVLVIGPYAFLDPIRREAGLAGRDGHAGSIETSTMLAVAEDLVRTDRIPAVPSRPRLSRFRVLADPGAEFPSGVRGDTTKVSRELGERTVRHIVTEVAELLARLDRGGAE
jgi:creatinine amidohydrolase